MTTTTMTTATTISAQLGDDGRCYTAEDGRTLGDLSREAGSRVERSDAGYVRYTYPDGSVITDAGPAWDLGYPDCWCWQGAGHTEECQGLES